MRKTAHFFFFHQSTCCLKFVFIVTAKCKDLHCLCFCVTPEPLLQLQNVISCSLNGVFLFKTITPYSHNSIATKKLSSNFITQLKGLHNHWHVLVNLCECVLLQCVKLSPPIWSPANYLPPASPPLPHNT